MVLGDVWDVPYSLENVPLYLAEGIFCPLICGGLPPTSSESIGYFKGLLSTGNAGLDAFAFYTIINDFIFCKSSEFSVITKLSRINVP